MMNDTVERADTKMPFVISRIYNCSDIDVKADRETCEHDSTDGTWEPDKVYGILYRVLNAPSSCYMHIDIVNISFFDNFQWLKGI